MIMRGRRMARLETGRLVSKAVYVTGVFRESEWLTLVFGGCRECLGGFIL